MRVLQIGPYSPPHGGIQGHLVALRSFLQEHDVICNVIDLNRLRHTDGKGVFGPSSALHLLWLLLRLPTDIIHLHIGGNLTARLLALSLLCNWLPRRKSVLTFHSGGYPSSPEGKIADPNTLRGWIMKQYDHVIGVNQEIVNVFRRYGLTQDQVSLIRPYYLPAAPPKLELPEPLRTFCLSHRPVFVSVGLLEPEYDLPIQIDVLGLIREKFPSAGLILIGSGSLEAELRTKIKSKSYSSDILLCGDVERAVTLRVIADSDIFLRTTLFDGDSISVREALHFGVPVVGSDRASRPEGVRLIPAENLDALRSAIEDGLREGKTTSPPLGPDERNLAAVLDLYRSVAPESSDAIESLRNYEPRG